MRFLIVISLFSLLFACKKAEDRKCWKSAGEDSSLTIHLPDFKKMTLGPHIRYTLVQDTSCYAIVRGGKNLLNFIQFEMPEEELYITNGNKCNFLRSYKKEVSVELHVRELDFIQYEGTKELICLNTLNQDYTSVVIRDGAGKFNLDINCYNLNFVITHGWGNFNLSGNVNYLRMEANGSGFGNAYSLVINDSVNVISNSSADLRIRANNIPFRVQTNSLGDVYYKGIPSYLEFNKYGEGNLIDEN